MAGPSEYDLKIDSQVEKFLETKQKLTYFLITASVAVIAFLFDFVHDNKTVAMNFAWLVILSSLSGLLTAGFSLLNIRYELQSYRLHLKSRYERKDYSTLDQREQKLWDRINYRASRLLILAFTFLFSEIFLAVLFFILVFSS
jgi:hypothetical protein